MSPKRILKAGDPRALGKTTKSGNHHKAVPDYVIAKLAKTGAKPRAIAKKLGADLDHVKRVIDGLDA